MLKKGVFYLTWNLVYIKYSFWLTMRRSNLPIYVDALYLFYSLTYYAFAMFILRAGLLGELCRKTER